MAHLPNDFPHWRTVYGYFADWGKIGIWKKIQRKLYFEARKLAGRDKYPSIVVIDSQSARTGKMGGERGFDGGKRVKGRKRHVVVDSLGLPLAMSVTAANVHALKGGRRVLRQVRKFLLRGSFRKMETGCMPRKLSVIGYVTAAKQLCVSPKIWPEVQRVHPGLATLGDRTGLSPGL